MGLVLRAILPDEAVHDKPDRYPTRHLILFCRPELWAIRHLLSEFTSFPLTWPAPLGTAWAS